LGIGDVQESGGVGETPNLAARLQSVSEHSGYCQCRHALSKSENITVT
jgi:hypothetical protein